MASLSVLITYFNEGKLLTECLESFWNAELRPDEILIYDDASTTRPEPFIPVGIPVRILQVEKNTGPGIGRNLLLNEATCDFIHFHDADDWVKPEWASLVMQKATSEIDVVFTEVESHRDGKLFCEKVVGFTPMERWEKLLSFSIRHFVLVPSGTFRREWVRRLGGFRDTLWQSEDFDFYVRLAAAKPQFKIISESLVGIRLRAESRSQNQTETYTSTLQALMLLQRELPKDFHPDIAEKAATVGSRLFELGELALAREAFLLAETLGPASFSWRGKIFQIIARRWGQETAEWLASLKKKFLPGY